VWPDFLARDAGSTDLSTHARELDLGNRTRRQVATELAHSDEWIRVIVEKLYQDTLGRVPDTDGWLFWTDAIGSGRLTVAKVAASFYASAEYLNGIGGGTLPTWVADLYEKVLGRTATEADVAYWVGQVPIRGRGWVALQIFQSRESAGTRVEDLYQILLGRAAEPSAVDFWGPRVVATGDIVLAIDLASSAEYLARAHTRFG
jgi:hypothetical protein